MNADRHTQVHYGPFTEKFSTYKGKCLRKLSVVQYANNVKRMIIMQDSDLTSVKSTTARPRATFSLVLENIMLDDSLYNHTFAIIRHFTIQDISK